MTSQHKTVCPVRKFLLSLSKEVSKNDLSAMMFLAAIPAGHVELLEKENNCFKFFQHLIDHQYITISPLNLTYLCDILPNQLLKTNVTDFVKAQNKRTAIQPSIPSSHRNQLEPVSDDFSSPSNTGNQCMGSPVTQNVHMISGDNSALTESVNSSNSNLLVSYANSCIRQEADDQLLHFTNISDNTFLRSVTSETSPKTLLESKTVIDTHSSGITMNETEEEITVYGMEDLEIDGIKKSAIDIDVNKITPELKMKFDSIELSNNLVIHDKCDIQKVPSSSNICKKDKVYQRIFPECRMTAPLNLFPDIAESSSKNSEDRDRFIEKSSLDGLSKINKTLKEAIVKQKNKNSQRQCDGTYSLFKERMDSNPHHVNVIAPVKLHDYQLELAQRGINGENCIICAPTGSGKTLTAAYICMKRMEKIKKSCAANVGNSEILLKFNALFVVCIRNLIQQQRDAICKVIVTENAVISINETNLLSEAMKQANVTVLTAQILVNCLVNKEVDISDFDLIIMDECHHTDLKHPYNQLMKFYHEALWAGREIHLPQIVGLTASLGVGASGGDDSEGTLLHYIRLCANLNSTCITYVKEKQHIEELLKYNPKKKKVPTATLR